MNTTHSRTTSDEECSHHNEVQQRGAFLKINYFNCIKIGFIICWGCCDRNSPSVICPQFSAEHHLVLLVKGHCRRTHPLFHRYTCAVHSLFTSGGIVATPALMDGEGSGAHLRMFVVAFLSCGSRSGSRRTSSRRPITPSFSSLLESKS